MTDGDCIVIDLKSRRRETTPRDRGAPAVGVDPNTDWDAATRILGMLATVLEQELPSLSAESADRPDFEGMLRHARRRAPS